MKTAARSWAAWICLASVALLGTAHAADAVRGKALYFTPYVNANGVPESCGSAGCHNGFPAAALNGIAKGVDPAKTLNAIAGDKGKMGFLSAYVNSVDAADIAAYIANPAAGDGSPTISLSATSVTFAAQIVGTPGAVQTVTVSNSGNAALILSALTLGGTARADFARSGGTCTAGTSVAPGGTCAIQLTFTPTAVGARGATLTIAHNATGGSSAVTLSGTGQPGPAVASVTPATLSFTQTVNSVSSAQAVTVANTGGLPLTVNTISVSGTNAAEYSIAAGSTCAAGTVVNAGANCTVRLTFAPTVLGARPAILSIAHSAAASPAAVALNGAGTATPQPGISLSSASLIFAQQSVGSRSASQTVTLTNSGQAVLTLGTLTLSGTTSADFTRAGSCAMGATVAADGTCSIQLSFAPTAVGTRSGTLTIASNASNGNGVVSLSGTAVQLSMSVIPTTASLQAPVGAMSPPVQAVISNTGASALTISSIALTGPFMFHTGSNSCGEGPMVLSSGQSCNVYVVFRAVAPGMASGEVLIESTASPAPIRIALTGRASQGSAGGGSAANAGFGGCSIGAPDQLVDPLLALMLAIALFVVIRRSARTKVR